MMRWMLPMPDARSQFSLEGEAILEVALQHGGYDSAILHDRWAHFEWRDGNGKQLGYGAKGHVSREDVIWLNDCADDEELLGEAKYQWAQLIQCDDSEFGLQPCCKRDRGAMPITIVEYAWRDR